MHKEIGYRDFLGMCGYYRSFLNNFSDVAALLRDLTKVLLEVELHSTRTEGGLLRNSRSYWVEQLIFMLHSTPDVSSCPAMTVTTPWSRLGHNGRYWYERPLGWSRPNFPTLRRGGVSWRGGLLCGIHYKNLIT